MASFLSPIISGLVATLCVWLIFRFAIRPEADEKGSLRVVAYSRGMKIVTLLLGAVTLFILYAASQARADQQFMAALVSLTLAAGYLWLVLEVAFTRLTYDAQGFVFKNLFGTKQAAWEEIADGDGPTGMGYIVILLKSGKKVRLSTMISGLDSFLKKVETIIRGLYPERFVPDDLALCNRSMIERSTECGCFHCLEIFAPAEISNWLPIEETDEEFGPPVRREETALCPKCRLHSVLGDAGGYPVTRESLQKVHDYVRGQGGF